ADTPHLIRDHVAKSGCDEKRVFGIADEADRGAITGVEYDAIVHRYASQGVGEQRIEPVFELDLLDDRFARVFRDIYEQDAADERPILEFGHCASIIPTNPRRYQWFVMLQISGRTRLDGPHE